MHELATGIRISMNTIKQTYWGTYCSLVGQVQTYSKCLLSSRPRGGLLQRTRAHLSFWPDQVAGQTGVALAREPVRPCAVPDAFLAIPVGVSLVAPSPVLEMQP